MSLRERSGRAAYADDEAGKDARAAGLNPDTLRAARRFAVPGRVTPGRDFIPGRDRRRKARLSDVSFSRTWALSAKSGQRSTNGTGSGILRGLVVEEDVDGVTLEDPFQAKADEVRPVPRERTPRQRDDLVGYVLSRRGVEDVGPTLLFPSAGPPTRSVPRLPGRDESSPGGHRVPLDRLPGWRRNLFLRHRWLRPIGGSRRCSLWGETRGGRCPVSHLFPEGTPARMRHLPDPPATPPRRAPRRTPGRRPWR